MSAAIDINNDELDELLSDNDMNTQSRINIKSSSCISQIQSISLSMSNKSQLNKEENQMKQSILTIKTSNIPGPVGLLPILKTNEDIKRLKEDKTARDKLLTNEETTNTKRTKTSSDLFSLNIDNYPSYAIALEQLRESFSCEPISINTALVKARLGIKKRIPLMCAAVTHYDRQENTILLDKSAHIRATFIGDDELLDNFNIRVGHTLVLRNVAVFTSIRHRHHYVNIHLQNIIAIQDPLIKSFSMPLISQDKNTKIIEDEISAYQHSSNVNNETFRVFSQSDHEDDDQPPLKKSNKNSSGFNQIQTKVNLTSNVKKFKETTITPSSINTDNDELKKQMEENFNSEDLGEEFFSSW